MFTKLRVSSVTHAEQEGKAGTGHERDETPGNFGNLRNGPR